MQDLMKLQNGSDIRGVALEGIEDEHVNLTPVIAKQIGCAFVSWLEKKSGIVAQQLVIGVGRDSRVTGQDLAFGLIQGIISAGAKAVDCKMATTPAMFMSIVFPETQFHGSAMITASHLPFNRNGIKFFDADGGLEHEDITEILNLASLLNPIDVNYFPTPVDLISIYAEHLKSTIIQGINSNSDKPLSGLKILVDAGNGAGGFFVDKILKPLGADTTGSQFLEPNGMFPNHIPNPENKQAMESIRSAVLKNNADFGLIFDTDVDRMSAVLDDGSEINRDAIIAMTAAILAPENPASTIITDSVTSDRLTYFLEEILGLKHFRYMRGYKNVINKQKELNAQGINAPLAMETSGHGALKENYYLDDGAYLAVKLIIALAKAKQEGKKLDGLIEKLPPLVEEGEFRFKIQSSDFKEYGKLVLNEFKARAQKANYNLPESYEGVRISFNNDEAQGWLLLRLSLHDPVMPLNIEGSRKGDVAKIKKIAKELLKDFDKLDISSID